MIDRRWKHRPIMPFGEAPSDKSLAMMERPALCTVKLSSSLPCCLRSAGYAMDDGTQQAWQGGCHDVGQCQCQCQSPEPARCGHRYFRNTWQQFALIRPAASDLQRIVHMPTGDVAPASH